MIDRCAVIFQFAILVGGSVALHNVYLAFRIEASIHYYHQRDILALAGVHPTPLPSAKKAKSHIIYIFIKLMQLIMCFQVLLSGLQVKETVKEI